MTHRFALPAALILLALPGLATADDKVHVAIEVDGEDDYGARIDIMLSGLDTPEPPPLPLPVVNEPDYDVVFLGVDFLPGVGSSSIVGDRQVRVFSANVIGGYSSGLVGVEAAGVFNIESEFARGVQGAGVFNIVDGPMSGAQGAGAFNIVDGPMGGIQGAGVFNVVDGDVGGVQASGAFNIVDGDVGGVQAAGTFNIVDGDVGGVQAAGLFNVVDGDVHGVQAGVMNIVSGEVHGVQLGVVNIADDVDGVGLGLVNIYPHGRFHIDTWMDETGQLSQGLKHGSSWLHNIYALGFNPARPLDVSATLGLGGHWNLPGPFFVDVDGMVRGNKLRGVPWGTLYQTTTLRGNMGMTLAPHLALIAGPSWNVLTTTCGQPEGRKVQVLSDTGKVKAYAWPGFSVGIQLL
jgi:hypothetical protein